MSQKYTVEVIKDPESGELVLPLPTELLNQMGWCEGTDLFWTDNNNGSYTISSKEQLNQKEDIVPNDTDVGC
jgi:hypothetical protein